MRTFYTLLSATVLVVAFAFPQHKLGELKKGAVVSNGLECAKIGAEVLKDNGSAVDAAIAVLFCEGVTGPQSMGIGGGFLATIYDHTTGKIRSLNSREAAPANSTERMFVGIDGKITGGHASAIPSELKGYAELHKKYGQLPWKRLVEPTINLCKNGHKVDKFLALILEQYKNQIMQEPTLKEIFVSNITKDVFKKGDIIYRPVLAETLKQIANSTVDVFYDGELGKTFVEDVQSMGGVLTLEDLKNYQVKWNDSIVNPINDEYTLYTIPLPGSGTVLSLILNILKGKVEKEDVTTIHRIIESFKHGYGFRSNLSDDAFNGQALKLVSKALSKDFPLSLQSKINDSQTSNDTAYYGNPRPDEIIDHGTANVAVIAPNGDAITVTSTINNVFGAFKRSVRTGIILNDEMDDFSTPDKENSYGFKPSPINFIRPGKRPMSSMSPSIILDRNGKVRLLIGAAGGSQITTSVALTIIRHLLFGKSLNNSINTPRFHHQLQPLEIQYHPGFDQELLNKLQDLKHGVKPVSSLAGFSAVTGIAVYDDGKTLNPVYDDSRGGSTAIYDPNTAEIQVKTAS